MTHAHSPCNIAALFVSISLLALLPACQTYSSGPHRLHAVGKAPETTKSQLLGTIQRLNGDWETQQDDGSWMPSSTFRTIAANSTVHETMYAGSPHEMVNLYHMDGNSILCTHYCAMGNQPRMRATRATTNPDGSVTVPFVCDGVTNLSKLDDQYMGQMTLTLKDNDHAVQTWQNMKSGRPEGGVMDMELRRRK